jgi:UDP-glucose 4-epimerase
MRVLITGGGGFIGSHLVTALLEAGHEVTIYDNFSRFGEEKLAHVTDKVNIVKGDIRDLNQLTSSVPNPEVVVHLAAVSRVDASIMSNVTTFEINGQGTINVLEHCRKFNSKMIFASSWMVYDQTEAANKKSLDEETKTNPVTPYGTSKLTGELYCRLFSHLYQVPTMVMRFSNVYGPGDKERLIPTLISRAKKGDEIHIFGKDQTLNFVNVEDVVLAICSAVARATSKELFSNTFNIGTENSIKLVELASQVISLCNSPSPLVVNPERSIDYKRYQPNITKARNIIGYQPKVDLQSGLNKCIEAEQQQS